MHIVLCVNLKYDTRMNDQCVRICLGDAQTLWFRWTHWGHTRTLITHVRYDNNSADWPLTVEESSSVSPTAPKRIMRQRASSWGKLFTVTKWTNSWEWQYLPSREFCCPIIQCKQLFRKTGAHIFAHWRRHPACCVCLPTLVRSRS